MDAASADYSINETIDQPRALIGVALAAPSRQLSDMGKGGEAGSVEGRKGRASFRWACLSLAGHERRDAQNDAAQIGA